MPKKASSKRVLTNKEQESRDAISLIDEFSSQLGRTIRDGFTRIQVRNMLLWHFVFKNGRKRYNAEIVNDSMYNDFCHEINSLFHFNILKSNTISDRSREYVSYLKFMIDEDRKKSGKDWVFRLNDNLIEMLSYWIYSQLPLESRLITKPEIQNVVEEVISQKGLLDPEDKHHVKEEKIRSAILELFGSEDTFFHLPEIQRRSEKNEKLPDSKLVSAFQQKDINTVTNYFWAHLREGKMERESDKSFTKGFVVRLMNCAYTYDVLLHARNKLGLFKDIDLLNDTDFIYKQFVAEFADLDTTMYQYEIYIHDLQSVETKWKELEELGDDFVKYDLPSLTVLEAEHKQLGEMLRRVPAGKSGEKIKKQIDTIYKRIGVLKDKQTVVIQNFARIKYFRTLTPRIKDLMRKIIVKLSQTIKNIGLLHQITGGYFYYNYFNEKANNFLTSKEKDELRTLFTKYDMTNENVNKIQEKSELDERLIQQVRELTNFNQKSKNVQNRIAKSLYQNSNRISELLLLSTYDAPPLSKNSSENLKAGIGKMLDLFKDIYPKNVGDVWHYLLVHPNIIIQSWGMAASKKIEFKKSHQDFTKVANSVVQNMFEKARVEYFKMIQHKMIQHKIKKQKPPTENAVPMARTIKPLNGRKLTYANVFKAPKKVTTITNEGKYLNRFNVGKYLNSFKKITMPSKKQIEELKLLMKAYKKQSPKKKNVLRIVRINNENGSTSSSNSTMNSQNRRRVRKERSREKNQLREETNRTKIKNRPSDKKGRG